MYTTANCKKQPKKKKKKKAWNVGRKDMILLAKQEIHTKIYILTEIRFGDIFLHPQNSQ